jgi:hypothetical protein
MIWTPIGSPVSCVRSLRRDGADPGRTRFGDDLGNGAMVARRHDVSAAYCRDLRKFLQQFDTDPLSLGFRVAGSCEPDEHDRFVNSVLNGKNAMPAWRGALNAGDIERLWVYIRAHAYDAGAK